MWVEILCGLILYKLVKRFFYADDLVELDTSDSSALFSVANRLEKLYGGKAYVGLKIPDADTAKPVTIDIVLVSDGEATVVSVKNVSGFVRVNPDGSWDCESDRKRVQLCDPVEEIRRQASVLESYVEQRGLASSFSCKIILPNPKSCVLQQSCFPPQVITYDQWSQLKAGHKSSLSGWIKGALGPAKKEAQPHDLNFILGTAPMWDRLELKGNKPVLGEFHEFKGKQQDMDALANIKRSKVGRVLVQSTSMLGLAPLRLQVLYSPRDYRAQGASTSEWKEVSVRSSTEVVFQPTNSTKLRKFKLSSILSMSLSA